MKDEKKMVVVPEMMVKQMMVIVLSILPQENFNYRYKSCLTTQSGSLGSETVTESPEMTMPHKVRSSDSGRPNVVPESSQTFFPLTVRPPPFPFSFSLRFTIYLIMNRNLSR